MQFESLKVFCDVARNRSFSLAALANDITQSAVSQIVSQLEKRMGVQLIDRSTRPLQLTSLGKTYYEGCQELLEQYMELEVAIRQAQTQLAGTVSVAAIYSVGLSDMGQYTESFALREPAARVHIEYLHPDKVYEKVLEGTADLGLVSFPRKSPKLTVVPWRQEEMVLACSPRHALARHLSVHPEQIAGERYIHFTRDLTIRREVDRFLREQGVSVEVVLEFDNIENIKKAIEIEAGVALLPEPTFRREVAGGSLVAVPLIDCQLLRPLGIIHRRQQKLSGATRCFLDLLCDSQDDDSFTVEGNGPGAGAAAAALPPQNSRNRMGNGSAHSSPKSQAR